MGVFSDAWKQSMEENKEKERLKKELEEKYPDKKEREAVIKKMKEAEAEKKAAQKELSEKNKAEQASMNSPVGKARRAYEAGQLYYQVSIPIEEVGRNFLNVISHEMKTRVIDTGDHVGALLTSIAQEGWELVDAGFTFRQTHQDSRDKFLASGQQVAITGQTIGVYIFKRKSQK